MSQRTYANEAANCRSWANECKGRHEQAFLLRVASEFENLADVANARSNIHKDDWTNFAQRASQEITAAVRATHPRARLAHLRLAQHYETLTHDGGRR